MKRFALQLVLAGAILGAAGLLVAWLGLIPIAASSGHWAVTSWFLHSAMRRAVQTQSLGIKVPELDHEQLVLRGAGHFHSGCAPCHGAPGVAPARVTREMTPHPPELSGRIDQWEPEELFWIVKHGVKFTGMPAWVAPQRNDEVWAMVAFLQRLPGLTDARYRRLAEGAHQHQGAGPGHGESAPESPAETALAECTRCHHRDGSGRGQGAFPRLADQSEQYLFAALKAYADGERFSGIMQPAASDLDEATLRDLARHYASREAVAVRSGTVVDPATYREGEDIARYGVPRQGIPSCLHCHGPSETPRNPYYPVLAGQYAEYLMLQLELFRDGRRGGSPFSPIMAAAAHRLEPAQIRSVAHYYAALAPDSGAGGAARVSDNARAETTSLGPR